MVLVNRCSIDCHIKLSANYIDFHRLLLITFLFPFSNRWKSMESHRILSHLLLIDFQYQSINCYRLISIGIDFDRLANSLTAYAGLNVSSSTGNWNGSRNYCVGINQRSCSWQPLDAKGNFEIRVSWLIRLHLIWFLTS